MLPQIPPIMPEQSYHEPAPLTTDEMVKEIYDAMQEIRGLVASINPKTVDKVAKLASNPLLAGLFGAGPTNG